MPEPLIYINLALALALTGAIFAAGKAYATLEAHAKRLDILEEKANHLSTLEKLTDIASVHEKEIERVRNRVDRFLDPPRYQGKDGC